MQISKTQTIDATSSLLTQLGIRHSLSALKEHLETHPDYPSLYSIYQVLNRYGLGSSPVEATADYLDAWKPPFIVRMKLPNTGADFACVTKINNGTIHIITALKQKSVAFRRNEFVQKWDGIALLPNPDSEAAQPDLQRHLEKDAQVMRNKNWIQWVLAGTMLILFCGLAWIHGLAWPVLVPWLVIKAIGVGAGIVLLAYEVNKQSETVKQFCTAGTTVNCDAVLQSKGARIGGISWSIAGFAWMTVALLTLLSGTSGVSIATIMTILAFPYTLYSIYYQGFIVKQWCLLCLLVQATLMAEFGWVMYHFFTGTLSFIPLPAIIGKGLLTLAGIPLIVSGWLWLKPLLQQGARLPAWQNAYKRLTNDKDVFFAMLQRQPKAPDGYKACSLLFGNANAKYEILKVCNPYCGPCARIHPVFEKIIKCNKDYNLRIIFVGATDTENKIGRTVRHFLNLYKERGAEYTSEVLHEWYETNDKNFERFTSKHPTRKWIDVSELAEEMDYWENEANIKGTPTIFINGQELPSEIDPMKLQNILCQ
jgi:uncharacterized membrane protein